MDTKPIESTTKLGQSEPPAQAMGEKAAWLPSTAQELDALVDSDVIAHTHVIVGANGKCLCGIYDGRPFTCADILQQRFTQIRDAVISANIVPGGIAVDRQLNPLPLLPTSEPPAPDDGKEEAMGRYDAGLLNDFGGGDVQWWQDYIRAELDRAHDFYQERWDNRPDCREIAELREATVPICVGKPIIQILAREGQWLSESGAGVIAADCLFQKDPYTEIDSLRAQLTAAREEIVQLTAQLSAK